MKLSQLTTEQLADMLLRITPPLCRIIRDESTLAALDELSFQGLDAQLPMKAASILWEKLTPVLLERHADDLYAVLAALTGKAPAAIRAQSGMATIADVIAVWDGELTAFFTSAGSAAQERS